MTNKAFFQLFKEVSMKLYVKSALENYWNEMFEDTRWAVWGKQFPFTQTWILLRFINHHDSNRIYVVCHSGGESKDDFCRVVDKCTNLLPADKPRYLMGVGYSEDLVVCVALGIDMFDCVSPTRTAVRTTHLNVISIRNIFSNFCVYKSFRFTFPMKIFDILHLCTNSPWRILVIFLPLVQ